MSLSVGNEVDLVLPALLLEALLRAPVMTNTAACQDDDQSPYQPKPCREPTEQVPLNIYPEKWCKLQPVKI